MWCVGWHNQYSRIYKYTHYRPCVRHPMAWKCKRCNNSTHNPLIAPPCRFYSTADTRAPKPNLFSVRLRFHLVLKVPTWLLELHSHVYVLVHTWFSGVQNINMQISPSVMDQNQPQRFSSPWELQKPSSLVLRFSFSKRSQFLVPTAITGSFFTHERAHKSYPKQKKIFQVINLSNSVRTSSWLKKFLFNIGF